MNQPERALSDEAALKLVVEGTASQTGTEFFRALVKNLAAVMDTAGAWVTEYLPKARRLRAHAFWLNGQFVENFEYDIAGTACARSLSPKSWSTFPTGLSSCMRSIRTCLRSTRSAIWACLCSIRAAR
jgi:hypothetical protein